MTIYKEWYVTLSFVGLVSSTLLAKESFIFSLTPSTIQPGNHAVLRVSVPIESNDSESSVVVNDSLLFENKSIHIIEKSSERNDCCLELKYELTGYKTENVTLPPVEIKTKDNSFSTEAQNLVIESKRTPEDLELRESFSTLSPPWPLLRWARWVIEFGLFILFLRFAYRKFRNFKSRRIIATVVKPEIPQEDPLLWLKIQIELLKTKLKEQPTNNQLVDEWGQIFRGYVERKLSVPALCWTTREIKTGIRNTENLLRLLPCLEESDHFKFQPEYKTRKPVLSLLNHFIAETETHLILCGN